MKVSPIDSLGSVNTASSLDDLLALKTAYMQKIQEIGKAAFKAEINHLFATVPGLIRLGWTQYTPYFNDGDACIFSVNGVMWLDQALWNEFDNDPNFLDDIYDWHECWGGWHQQNVPDPIAEFTEKIQTSTELMLELFGDHATVICDQNEITISTCNHD